MSHPIYLKMTSIEIANIHETIEPSTILSRCKPGDIVVVRPCADKFDKKSFLGMYLCAAPTSFTAIQDGEKIILTMGKHTNPAIYIPEVDEIVWGYSSWWKRIESPDDMKDITDQDIENVWYVKAIRQISNDHKL